MAAPAAYSRRSYVGNASATTVPLGMASGDSSCALASGTNWPSGSGGDFLVVIDRSLNTEEKAWCSSTSGTTLTFAARGAEGTTAQLHTAGCSIALCTGSQDADEANQVANQVFGQASAAKGDILAMLSTAGPNTLTRVPIGTSTQVLGVASGLPAWETPANGYGIAGFAANPMTPAVSLTSTTAWLTGANVTLTANTAVNIKSLSLAAGTWLLIGTVAVLNNNTSQQQCTLWLSTTTASGTGLVATATVDTGIAAGGDEVLAQSMFAVVTPAITTTYYLNGYHTNVNGAALYQELIFGFGNCTGIIAIRIA
jgi:hypothetical protein